MLSHGAVVPCPWYGKPFEQTPFEQTPFEHISFEAIKPLVVYE